LTDCVVFEICVRTDRHTDILAILHTPTGDEVINHLDDTFAGHTPIEINNWFKVAKDTYWLWCRE